MVKRRAFLGRFYAAVTIAILIAPGAAGQTRGRSFL
jgi:hypothetical protein